ncbi:Crp/Fnr family transcriptional regulator [Mucilaginibacter sp. E4BP6]|uniref:Crp/Fnr family transcriptional regulator n=1 Tax=Mucilaginibacter sp. E4BP6 TaxID=2723089 RepID=UPI0015C97272|nr:Crp/Fnr family transcriptional regulator [Mucilaginibacter sp. E4BP6]
MFSALRQQFEEFIELSEEEIKYVASFFQMKKFKKHAIILHAGELVDHEYFVMKGLLKTALTDEKGKEHILQLAMENWWVSDYDALTTHERTIFEISCLENVEVLLLTLNKKEQLCREMHKMEHFFRLKATSGFINGQKRIIALLKNDAQSRYTELFEKYPSLFQRVPKSVLASYLGVSRETLSRFSKG